MRESASPATSLDDQVPDDLNAEHTDDAQAPLAGTWGPVVAGVVPLLLGAVMMQQSYTLGLGSLTAPEPGLWPFTLSTVLVALSIGLLIGFRRFRDCEAFTRSSLLVVVGAASVAAFIVALPEIGFEVPGLIVLALWLKVLGKESWLITLLVPVGTVAIFHLLFIELLGVPLPHLIAF